MTLTRQDAVLSWNEPSPVPLRGTVVLLPGRGESPQVYERFGRRLAADAYRVHAVTAPSESAELAHEQLVALLDSGRRGHTAHRRGLGCGRRLRRPPGR